MPVRDNDILLRLGQLVENLTAQGFYFGTDTHLLLARFFSETAEKPRSVETLKFQLAALLSHSGEEQQRFYSIFNQFVEQYKIETLSEVGSEKGGTDERPKPEESEKEQIPPPDAAPETKPSKPVARPIAGRSGPIRHELTAFPQNLWRIWNTAKMDAAMIPLREKELMPTFEWDIPASIRRTIRDGGIPHFVFRQRKRAPQYLFLIDQRSPEDHLAGFYAELALEMQRRDLAAEFYFYNFIPSRCWRDRRNPHAYTYIQRLQSEYDGYKLIIVGEAAGLLERPALRPSNLARDLLEGWREVALLCPKSTAQWGRAELALCQLFPVVPANAEGLNSLVRQWAATEVLTPEYWQRAVPEPSVPEIERGDEDVADIIQNLKYYLDREGFHWLCAAATYPELYWRLTALFNDESVVPKPGLAERDQNQIWQRILLRLSRLQWMRDGVIPDHIRMKLQEMLPDEKIAPVREQLLEVLKLNEDGFLSQKNSYAAADYTFTVARYEYEHALHDPNSTEADLQSKETALRQTIATVAPSDISDAKGVELWEQIASAEPSPGGSGFHVLWVDDYPENNKDIVQDLSKQLGATFTQVVSTNEALEHLDNGTFNAIISDLGRGDTEWAGLELLEELRKRQLTIPSAIFCSTRRANENRERLLSAGAQVVTGSGVDLRKWVERLLGQSQKGDASLSEDAIRVSKAVCRVVVDGSLGTGFLIEGGYLITCHHIIASPDAAKTARVEFNYEIDETGKLSTPVVYQLDPLDFITSDSKELDFTRIKIIDRSDAPLSQWGNIELETSVVPAAGETLSMIHHAGGEAKKVESNTITVLEQRDKYLYYTGIRNPGSAGAPVLNKDWRAVVLHHAFKTLDITGKAQEVREGVLVRGIFEFIRKTENDAKGKGENKSLRRQIQQLIGDGETKKALELLVQASPDAQLLLSRHNQDEKRLLLGTIEFSVWERILEQVNFEALEMAEKLEVENEARKEQMQRLIASGQTKDALELLVQANPDALLLQTQYNNGEKQFNLGLIDFSEWQRIQNRVNFAALEMVGKMEDEKKHETIEQKKHTEPEKEGGRTLYRILIVDDDPNFHRQIRDGLGKHFEFKNVDTVEKLWRSLDEAGHFDLILLDLELTDSDDKTLGLETLLQLIQKLPDIPIIVVANRPDYQSATVAIKQGANDYLAKESYDGELWSNKFRSLIEEQDVKKETKKSQNFIPRIFISYAHEDKKHKEKFLNILKILQNNGFDVEIREDSQIQHGIKWREEISRLMDSANVFIFLVSDYLLASDFVTQVEIPAALSTHKQHGALILPVLLTPSQWQASVLANFQKLPESKEYLSQIRDRDEAWFEVAKGMKDILERVFPASARQV